MDLMKRLSKAKTGLILEHPFVGSIALNMPMVLSDKVPTAATNGKRVLFNPDFIEGLSDDELKFLVAHECMHPMLEHNWRRNGRDPKRWNIAADYVINKLLVDEGIGKFIEGGCLDDNIYAEGGGTSDGIYNVLPVDTGEGGGDGPGGPGNDLEDAEGTSAEQAREAGEWKVRVAQAAQAAKMAGKLSANIARLVDEILQPKVDWTDVLRRFMQKAKTDERTFARPNRRFISQGLYLPTVSGETLGEVVFAVDMSGSISQEECSQYAAECRAVFEDNKPTKLHFIYFSHEVCGHDTLNRDDDFQFNPRGGGGTAFSPVFQYIQEQGIEAAAIVFLTDLYCDDFGTAPDCPVLWVSTGADKAPFGEVCMMG